MVDDIDKEMTLEECHALIDRLRERLRTVRKGLMSKELPEPYVLNELGHYADWPRDWEAGKTLQREVGAEAVPYKSECESGAGFWQRLNRADLPPKVAEWQPIETAPRDGTHILAAWVPGNMPRWVRETIMWVDGEWVATWSHEPILSRPTHWVPLPEPPTP